MRLIPISFNGFNLNDMMSSTAKFVDPHMWSLQSSSPNSMNRSLRYPVYTNKKLNERVFSVNIFITDCSPTSVRNVLTRKLDTADQNEYQFIARDSDTGLLYYVNATVSSLVCENDYATEWTATFLASDPVWFSVKEYGVSETVTASGTEFSVNNLGNNRANPLIEITPNEMRSGGWGYSRFIKVVNNSLLSAVNAPIDISNGGLDTATLVTATKMQADGDDLRIIVDGIEVNRWLANMNTASTKIWVNLNLRPQATFVLKTALDATTTGIEILVNPAYKSVKVGKKSRTVYTLDGFAESGILVIDNEIFTYTSKDDTRGAFTGVTRAQHGSSMAIHAVSSVITYIDHAIYLIYGNSTAPAPTNDDALKPIIDLEESTNISHVYYDFYEPNARQSGIFRPSVLYTSGGQSKFYYEQNLGIYPSDIDLDMSTVPDGTIFDWIADTFLVSSGKLYNTPTVSATELLTNGDFSVTTGWTAVDGTLASVAGGQAGNAGQLTRTGGTSQSISRDITTVAGQYYEASVYVKSGTSGDEEAQLIMMSGVKVIAKVVMATSGAWVKMRCGGVADGTTITFKLVKNSVTAGTMLFDTASGKLITDTVGIVRTSSFHGTVSSNFTRVATPANYGGFGVVINSNLLKTSGVYAFHNGSDIVFYKMVLGAYTELERTATAYSAGAELKIERDIETNTYRVFYNDVQIGTDQTVTNSEIITNDYIGIIDASSSGNYVENFLYDANGGALGLMALNYQVSNKWLTEKYSIVWRLVNFVGITQASYSGYIKRKYVTTPFPVVIGLQVSLNDISYVSKKQETNTTLVDTWVAFNNSSVLLGYTYNYIQFIINGSTANGIGDSFMYEIRKLVLTLDSTKAPTITVAAESSQYWMDMDITNEETGDILSIEGAVIPDAKLVIDTELKSIYQELDGVNKGSMLSLNSVRMDWLPLLPGLNTIKVEEEGLDSVTLDFTWRIRNN